MRNRWVIPREEMVDGRHEQEAAEKEEEWRLRIDGTGGSCGWPGGDGGNICEIEEKPGDAAMILPTDRQKCLGRY